jgi:hypothetical protein
VSIAAKIFEVNFLNDDQCPEVISQLEHNFFLMAFRQLKCHGSKISLLIWKLYLQREMDMLFWEIYGEIFSCMICMSLFSHNNRK